MNTGNLIPNGVLAGINRLPTGPCDRRNPRVSNCLSVDSWSLMAQKRKAVGITRTEHPPTLAGAGFLVFLLLTAIALSTACSSKEPEPGSIAEPWTQTSSSSALLTRDAFTARYAELREQGKSHKAATELAKIHASGSADSANLTDIDVRHAMARAVVLARFSASDSSEAVRHEQAAEELKLRFQSRGLDADRAPNLLDKMAPLASIDKRSAAAGNLVRLSKSQEWNAETTKKTAFV